VDFLCCSPDDNESGLRYPKGTFAPVGVANAAMQQQPPIQKSQSTNFLTS
jgi:hypothetical protein